MSRDSLWEASEDGLPTKLSTVHLKELAFLLLLRALPVLWGWTSQRDRIVAFLLRCKPDNKIGHTVRVGGARPAMRREASDVAEVWL